MICELIIFCIYVSSGGGVVSGAMGGGGEGEGMECGEIGI